MTRTLKASGFLGLAVMMTVGLYQFTLLSTGTAVPAWLVGGHAHLGVLSILAVVMGFAVPAIEVTGTLRTAVTVTFVAGQWGIPGVVWIGEGFGVTLLLPTGFLWGGCLVASMLAMFYRTLTLEAESAGRGPSSASPADD